MHNGYRLNEHGTRYSRHVCDTCEREYTCTPAVGPDNGLARDCLALECPSFDASKSLLHQLPDCP